MKKPAFLVAVALSTACFDPSGVDTQLADDPSTGANPPDPGSSTGDASASGVPGDEEGQSSESGDESGSDGASDDESSGDDGPLPAGCGNGVVDAGEVCMKPPVVLDYPAGGGGVAIADLDGDDHLDVVIADTGAGGPTAPRVRLGDGAGGFGEPRLAMAPDQPIGPIALGAIADGVVDIVASSWSSAYRWRGLGDGAFGAAGNVAPSLADIELVDVDADGRLDLVSIAVGGEGLEIRRADANEQFGAPTLLSNLGTDVTNSVVVSGHIGGDDNVDLVAGGYSGVAVFHGAGDGSFGSPQVYLPYTSVGGLAIADFDGDGTGDLAAGYAGMVTVRRSIDDAGTLGEPIEVPGPGWISALAAPDLDDDGLADLVTLHFDGSLGIARNEGDASFPVLQLVALPDGGYQVALAIGDLDEDGAFDVVTVGADGAATHLVLSDP